MQPLIRSRDRATVAVPESGGKHSDVQTRTGFMLDTNYLLRPKSHFTHQEPTFAQFNMCWTESATSTPVAFLAILD